MSTRTSPTGTGLRGSRTYRHLLAAQVVALVGTGLLTVALGLLAYDLDPGAASTVLATALTIKILAYVLLSPVIAALVHRVPRRGVLVGADVVRGLVALALPFVDAVWQVYLLVLVLQAASAAFTPAYQAVLPDVLPDERDYTHALSFSRLAYDLESVLSPLLAGALLLVVTYHALFVGTVLGFAGSALLVLGVRLPAAAAGGAEEVPFRTRVLAGSRGFLARGPLRGVWALDLVVAAATGLVLVDTVQVVRGDLGRGDTDVALALAAFGLGSALTALTVPRALDRVADRTVMVGGGLLVVLGLLAAAAQLSSGSGTTWAGLLGTWVVLGTATSLVLTPGGRVVRRYTEPAGRSAAFAAHFSLSHACYLLTYPAAGLVATWRGSGTAAAVLTGLAGVGLGLALRAWPSTARGPAD